jgi:hypothetical protein
LAILVATGAVLALGGFGAGWLARGDGVDRACISRGENSRRQRWEEILRALGRAEPIAHADSPRRGWEMAKQLSDVRGIKKAERQRERTAK